MGPFQVADRRTLALFANQGGEYDELAKFLPEFADMRAAYDDLVDERKAQLEGLLGTHSYAYSQGKVGGLEEHIHVLLEIPPPVPVSKAVQLLKGNSSRWIRLTFPELDGAEELLHRRCLLDAHSVR